MDSCECFLRSNNSRPCGLEEVITYSLCSSYFRSEETKESVLVIPVGNVTADAELTYEYGVRSNPKKAKTPSAQAKGTSSAAAAAAAAPPPPPPPPPAQASSSGIPVQPLTVDGKPHLPFQLQIEYTGRDGSRCLRVISEAKPTTRDRNMAERGVG